MHHQTFGTEEARKKETANLKHVLNVPMTCIVHINWLKSFVGIIISVSVAKRTSIVQQDNFVKPAHANLETD